MSSPICTPAVDGNVRFSVMYCHPLYRNMGVGGFTRLMGKSRAATAAAPPVHTSAIKCAFGFNPSFRMRLLERAT